MDGLLSVFCTLRPVSIENGQYLLEISLRNEGSKALRNFSVSASSPMGFNFKNVRGQFTKSQLVENISLLRSQQCKTLTIEVMLNSESAGAALSISASPPRDSSNRDKLTVEMSIREELKTSA
jgi:hypothetical protein